MMGRINKKVVIIGGAVLVTALLGVGGWLIWQNMNSAKINSSSTTTVPTGTSANAVFQDYVNNINVAAGKAAANGDLTAANQIYDDAIKQTSSDTEKSRLYAEKASTALGAGDTAGALGDAKEGESLGETSFEIYNMLAFIYEQQGEKMKAAEYYRKIAAIVPEVSDEDPTSYGSQYYLDLATELEK